jgi:hypothetical protein
MLLLFVVSVADADTSILCIRPFASLSSDDISHYNLLCEVAADPCTSTLDAFSNYLNALQICDQDIKLHSMIAHMANSMGMEPQNI